MEIIGKIIPPFLLRCKEVESIIFIVSFVPSLPELHGTFLNHFDFFAIVSDIPDTSLIIKSNFLPSQGPRNDPFFNSKLHLCILKFFSALVN